MTLSDMIHLISLMLDRVAMAFGLALVLAALWLAPPQLYSDARRRTWVLMAAIGSMALAALVELLLRTAVMADVPALQAWGFIPRVLGHSDYGYYWQWRAGFWLCMALLSVWIHCRGWKTLPTLLILAAMVSTLPLLSVTSHAGDDGLVSPANVMNGLHLLGISLWGGAVMLYALMVLPEQRNNRRSSNQALTATRLSTLATVALAVVIISGIYNTWQQLNTLADLWLTAYGRVLVLKLALVMMMMAIGALNRFYWVPDVVAWYRQGGQHWGAASERLLQVLRFDSVVFITILVVAVILGTQSPPGH